MEAEGGDGFGIEVGSAEVDREHEGEDFPGDPPPKKLGRLFRSPKECMGIGEETPGPGDVGPGLRLVVGTEGAGVNLPGWAVETEALRTESCWFVVVPVVPRFASLSLSA